MQSPKTPSGPVRREDRFESERGEDLRQSPLALCDCFSARKFLLGASSVLPAETAHERLHLAHLAPFPQDFRDALVFVLARVGLGLLVRRQDLVRVEASESGDEFAQLCDDGVSLGRN